MFNLETFKDQDIFVKAVLSGLYKYLLLGGDVRSGKSIIDLALILLFAKAYPGSRWFIVRKDRPVLLRTTIPTFKKWCSPYPFVDFNRNFNKSELKLTCQNGSEINFLSESFKDDPDCNNFRGLEANGFLLEQVEELQKQTYYWCTQRTGQWFLDPMPPAIVLMNCNPTDNWAKELYYDPWVDGELKPPFYFQLANIRNNPHIDKSYIEDMRKVLPPEMFDRFLAGNWDAVDEIWQLVPWESINACKRKLEDTDNEFALGVDVGRDGPDPTVYTILKGWNKHKIESYPKTKIPEVTTGTTRIMNEYNIPDNRVCVDAVGLGAGVVDELELLGLNVVSHVGGAGCSEEIENTNFSFSNLRSFTHWITAEKLKQGKVGNFTEKKLRSDAGAIRYGIKGDKSIYIESKDEFKKRTKRSSDYWDSFTYAVWAKEHDKYEAMPGMVTI